MSTATETIPSAPTSAAAPSRIGPFEILGRMPGDGGAGVVALSVKGMDGGPFAGRAGIAQCVAAPKDEDGRARLSGILAKLVDLSHPALSAPLAADLAGNVAYVVNACPPAEIPNASWPAAALAPSQVAELVLSVSAALETAHRAGVSHGDLTRRTVSLGEDGPVVAGWTLFGRGPAADQLGLATLVVDWLSGSAVEAVPVNAGEPRQRRVERLRRHLDGLTEQLVMVLARATELEVADRYPTLTDFVAAFQQAVTRSGEELVHGGFEALSGRSPEVAALMAASAERYDAQAPGLDLLKLQLGSRAVPYAAVMAPSGIPPALAPAAGSGGPAVMAGLDPALTAGIPPGMLALIAPPIPTTAKPRNNPWLVMIVGAAGLTLLLMVGLAVALLAGSN